MKNIFLYAEFTDDINCAGGVHSFLNVVIPKEDLPLVEPLVKIAKLINVEIESTNEPVNWSIGDFFEKYNIRVRDFSRNLAK